MPGAPLTRPRRLALLAIGVVVLAALYGMAPQARDSLTYGGPLFLLVGLMLAGIHPDEVVERIERLVRRAPGAASRRRRSWRTLGRPRRSPVGVVRSGLLIASSLATRPPPLRARAAA